MSNVIGSQVQEWRRKAREGTLSVAEARAAVDAIRVERVGAAEVSAASKVKKASTAKKKEPIDSDALLQQLF